MEDSTPDTRVKTAFISGPIDQPDDYFELHYQPLINIAIEQGHSFVLGPAPGTDTLALEYLTEKGVKPSLITVYLAEFQNLMLADHFQHFRNLEVQFKVEGLTTGDRDAAMTRDSDYDILRYMTIQEQKAFYGDKYFPRVNNTEKNERRRQGLPVNYIIVDLEWEEARRVRQEGLTAAANARKGAEGSSAWVAKLKRKVGKYIG